MSGGVIHVDLFSQDRLHKHAYRFFADDSRFCLALAGRRGAKSYTGAKRFLRKMWFGDWPKYANAPYSPGAARKGTALWWDRRPRMHYWVVADEYKLLDEPKRYLLQFLPPELLDHADNGAGKWWLKGDILIEFRTAHDPKSLVAAGLNGLWMEEGDRMRPDAWKGFLRPTLSDKRGWAQVTTTPLGRTWTWDDFEKPARDGVPGYGFHTWRTVDNTLLPDLAEEVAQAKLTLPDQYFRREYEASRDAFIGQIYPEFDEHKMVEPAIRFDARTGAPILPRDLVLYTRAGGQDWGFTNPGAAIVGGASATNLKQAHLWIVDERYKPSRLVEDYWIPEVLGLNSSWKFNDWACDPESPDNIARYKDNGIHAFGARNFSTSKYDEPQRSVKAGIRLLSSLMHQGRFHITGNCQETIAELKAYRWKDAPGASGVSEAFVEEPAPGQRNHGCDASRYMATSLLKGANFEALGIAA